MKTLSLGAVAVAMLMGTASAARAQASTEVSAGYQFGHVSADGFGETFPYGWNVDASHVIRPMIAVVGEVGGIYKSVGGITEHEHTFQGGVRMFVGANPMVRPYGQVLIGDVNAGGGGSSANAFSLQLGGGADIKAIGALNVRVGVDYRRDFFSDTNGGGENVVRVVLGVVFPLGGK